MHAFCMFYLYVSLGLNQQYPIRNIDLFARELYYGNSLKTPREHLLRSREMENKITSECE